MSKDILSEKEYLRVSELNQLVRQVIEIGFPRAVWVCGEVQGFNRNKDKRHVFFELCEKDQGGKTILARIGLVIFESRKAGILAILSSSENAFELKDDIEVKFLCRVDFYPPHGAVRLVVEGIDPVYTLGKIAQEKQKLIAFLKKNGILERNKSLSVPVVPLRVGLITSFDSAAYNDFVAELRSSGFGFRIMVRNALMQGKQVESDVCRALEEVERLSPDVVVVTRGGGSLAELSCFDSRAIAERIARCPYPVLSGIGHEINITVTDLAANVYQKTPTAIARFLVERVEDFLSGMDVRVRAVRESAQSMLECRRQNLGCKSRRFQALLNRFLWSHHRRLMQFSELMRLLPVRVLKQRRADLAVHGKRLRAAPGAFLDFRKKTLANFEKVVRLADPQNILRRGFSVTRAACGRTIRSQRDVRAGEVIVTQVSEGHFKSRVEDDSGPGKEQGGKHGAVKI